MPDDITIRFNGEGTVVDVLPVIFDDEHILDVAFSAGRVVRSITVLEPTRWLPAASALGKRGGFSIVQDAAKDCVCIEFREGVAASGDNLVGDGVDLEGKPFLRLLWGSSEELVGIVIWDASRWLRSAPPSSPAGTSYMPKGDAFCLKLFEGELVPSDLHGGTVVFDGGLEVAVSLDANGRLQMLVVLRASEWLPSATLSGPRGLSVIPVDGELDTVFFEVHAGGASAFARNEGVQVEGFELHAAFDRDDRLVGFIVPDGRDSLPPPFDDVGH